MNNLLKIITPFLLILPSFAAFCQTEIKLEERPKLTIFKFYPIELGKSTLKVGLESFNKTRSSSWVINAGLIYEYTDNVTNYYYQFSSSIPQPIEGNFSSQKGFNIEIEKRFYVPYLKDYKKPKNDNINRYGFYISPYVQVESQSQKFQSNYYNTFDPIKQVQITPGVLVENSGSSKIFAITPGFTIGTQTSLWDVAYLDLFLGAGLRILDNNPTVNFHSYNYSSNSNSYNTRGIVPKIGFAVGIKL